MDDSALPALRRRYPARTYVEIEEISSAIKISTSSMADDISTMPTVPNRIKCVILAAADVLHVKVFERSQNTDGGDGRNQQVEEDGEVVNPHHAKPAGIAEAGIAVHPRDLAERGSNSGDGPDERNQAQAFAAGTGFE